MWVLVFKPSTSLLVVPVGTASGRTVGVLVGDCTPHPPPKVDYISLIWGCEFISSSGPAFLFRGAAGRKVEIAPK